MTVRALTFQISVADMEDPQRFAEVLTDALNQIAERVNAAQGLQGNAEVKGELVVLDDEENQIAGFLRT